MAPTGPITTELTKVLGIKHPILLAGMARVSGGLAAGRAAVSNAGGGPRREWRLPSTPPAQLKEFIDEMKGQPSAPTHPDLPFGVGPGAAAGGRRRRRRARPTNDYTDYGKLGVELIELTIGPAKALDLGVDMACARGTEGRGGHTGERLPHVGPGARRGRRRAAATGPPMLGGAAAWPPRSCRARVGRPVVGTRFVVVAATEAESKKQATYHVARPTFAAADKCP
ncbi:hypothetical protein V2A60_008253 [Cordyceps javanica]